MRRLAALLLLLLLALPQPAQAAPQRVALFPFELVNTSLEPTRPDEAARLAGLVRQAGERLAAAGYEIVETTPVAAEIAEVSSLKDCNGCELDMAQELGADLAAVGWVQKVSNLILNINLQLREVATGRLVKAGSVDIRGNTDESWRRGVTYLIDRRIAAR
jgi:hypothetical protein